MRIGMDNGCKSLLYTNMFRYLRSISHRHRIHDAPVSLMAVACVASATVVFSDNRGGEQRKRVILHRQSRLPAQICECEANDGSPTSRPASKEYASPKPLSRLTLLLYASKIYPYSYLRVPRLLTPQDPIFTDPKLKRGLSCRRNDEERLQHILSSPELISARENQDHEKLQMILTQMNSVLYGEGVSPQIREDFLMQYGCTGYTADVLQYLVRTFGNRGIIEIGAGNGQWARALSDHHHGAKRKQQNQDNLNYSSMSWEFVVAYDNMEQLPLSPNIYHKNTVPARKYFFDVQHLSHTDAVQGSYGRALLLVYPPPGPMALETVLTYLRGPSGYAGSYKNDTVIYVGEGRGGANADDAFFDYILGSDVSNGKSQWVLEKVMDVYPCPGGKGYEKLFVFRCKVAFNAVS